MVMFGGGARRLESRQVAANGPYHATDGSSGEVGMTVSRVIQQGVAPRRAGVIYLTGRCGVAFRTAFSAIGPRIATSIWRSARTAISGRPGAHQSMRFEAGQ